VDDEQRMPARGRPRDDCWAGGAVRHRRKRRNRRTGASPAERFAPSIGRRY